MNDNLKTNQNLFSLMHSEHGSINEYSINHPIPNAIFEQMYWLLIILRSRRVYRPVAFYVAFWRRIHYRTICSPWNIASSDMS